MPTSAEVEERLATRDRPAAPFATIAEEAR